MWRCKWIGYYIICDDMTVGCSSANIDNLYLSMNLILDLFQKWFTANMLTVNTNKSKYILFHRTDKPVTDLLFSLYLSLPPSVTGEVYYFICYLSFEGSLRVHSEIDSVRLSVCSTIFQRIAGLQFYPKSFMLCINGFVSTSSTN